MTRLVGQPRVHTSRLPSRPFAAHHTLRVDRADLMRPPWADRRSTGGQVRRLISGGKVARPRELRSCPVSLDALACRPEIAEQITARGGDYLLALKGKRKSAAWDNG